MSRILMVLLMATPAAAAEVASGPVYGVVEITFTGPTYGPSGSPSTDVDFWVRFRHQSGSPEYKVHGFWDGNGTGGTSGNVFKVRFCPTKTGRWDLVQVFSNKSELNGEKQGDHLTARSSSHRGFWIPDGRWFRRSDGSRQYIVGNTHYDFLSRPDGNEASSSSIQKDVSDNAVYFKKLRFCLMSPRSENASSALRPFFDSSGNPTHTETDRPNPKFFRERVDPAVAKGFEKDLICDLILGGTAGDQVADRQGYMKYVAARYGAYPNVWITLANEWDEQASASHEKANGDYLRTILAYPTPMSTHGLGGWKTALNGSWCSHSIRQQKTGDLSDAASGMVTDHSNNQGKPTVNDENSYDPGEASTPDVVEGVTGSFSGGGYGTTGHKTSSKKGGYFWGHAARGKSITEHPSTSHLKFLREKIDEHVSFWQMTPKSSGSSIFSGANSGFRVLEWASNEYVLASDASDGSVTANLPSGTWTVVQLDIWAKSESILSTSASGSYAFSTPGSRAALTIFKKTGGGGPSIPTAPAGLQATTASTSRIDVSWTDASSNEDGFRVERSLDNSAFVNVGTVGPGVTSFGNTGLSSGTTYYYRVVAFNSAGSSSPSNVDSATTDTPTTVAIASPAAGTTFTPGQAVTATGTGTNLSWSVDRTNDGQGPISTGTGASVSFTVPLDSTGTQAIAVTLTGTGGTDSRTYGIVDSMPSVTTVSSDLTAATVGVAYSDDLEAAGGDAPLAWTATNLPPGLSVSGSEIAGTPTTAGTFTFTVTVTDNDGDSEQKTLTLTVSNTPPPPNQAPSAAISAPTDQAGYAPGDTVTYAGSGTDPEDGALTGASLSWEFDRIGDGLGVVHMSSGQTGSYGFPAGITQDTEYRLTLTATDSGGASDSRTVTVWVRPVSGGIGITNTTPAGYVWDVAADGKLQYIDRGYTLSNVPAAYVGLPFLRTANDHKGSSGNAFIQFDVDQDVTVYVAHDDRFTSKPPWMSSFVDTADDLTPGFSLFARDYPAGTVILGGNTADGVARNSMYSVVVGPRSGGGSGDSDDDGLPDAWELTHFNGLAEGPGGDPDGDGSTNLQEYQAGTDPMDPGSPAGPGAVPTGTSSGSSGSSCGALGLEVLMVLGLGALFRRRII